MRCQGWDGMAGSSSTWEAAGGGTCGAPEPSLGQGFPRISPEVPAKPLLVSGYSVNKSHLQFLSNKYLSQGWLCL